MTGYTTWTSHDEDGMSYEEAEHDEEQEWMLDGHDEESNDDEEDELGLESDETEEAEADTIIIGGKLAGMVHGQYMQELIVKETSTEIAARREATKLVTLVKDSTTPLYVGCKPEHTRLSVMMNLLDIKAKSYSTDTSLDMNLKFLHDVLPDGNVLPKSIDEAKVLCPLDMEPIKYHACKNDCIIYRNEHSKLIRCPTCKAPRFKRGNNSRGDNDDENAPASGTPHKVVWYFPIIPRLKRLYANKKQAKLMLWHANRKNKDDGVIRHVADGRQWKAIDDQFPHFSGDDRNVRLGYSVDGLNPFSNQSSVHSTWPVVVCIYNLPPWVCMKRKYLHMVMLI